MSPTYKDLIAFHGHSCPGLAIGCRMSKAALSFLSGPKAENEELVAIVENDACGVNALQCLSGCTFGNDNLIFKDHGKHIYTLFKRESGKGVRVVFNAPNIPENVRQNREQFIEWLLTVPEEEVVKLREVKIDEPEPARVMDSVECKFCGKNVMKKRIKRIGDKRACIPRAEKH